MYSHTLLEQLQTDVREVLLQAQQLQHLPNHMLTREPAPGKWSIAQVLEHLNFYSRHYILAIEQKLHLHQTEPQVKFAPGWLGNYFTNLMKPGADNTISKKMKSPKNALPSVQPDAKLVLDEFINHQHHLLNLLQLAKTADLNSIRIPTSLSKFIALKLGDTFRFFVAHEQRHLIQIKNVLMSINSGMSAAA